MEKHKVLVVGLGISGMAVCEALSKDPHTTVTALDAKPLDDLNLSPQKVKELSQKGCAFITGCNEVQDLKHYDEVIISPGVPLEAPIVVEAKKLGVAVISELEWAWKRIEAITIAVTGTNGKTTTTELVGSIVSKWSKRVFVGGNIGVPLSNLLTRNLEAPPDVVVTEVSSFQLDASPLFSPDVFVVLNITEDHLERYESFDHYCRSKMSPLLRPKDHQWFVLNKDDREIMRIFAEYEKAGTFKATRSLFWSRVDSEAHGFIDGGSLKINLPSSFEPLQPGESQRSFLFPFANTNLRGRHNEENMAAAALACLALGVPWTYIEEGLRDFQPGAHRIEWVDHINGIDFYDDSKATNVDAVVRALEGFEKPVWLLLGGRDKGGSYDRLWEEAARKCKGLVIFGEARSRMIASLDSFNSLKTFQIIEANNLEEAFYIALSKAQEGEVILLSPACSSFDQYRSYAERGDHFKSLVAKLRSHGLKS